MQRENVDSDLSNLLTELQEKLGSTYKILRRNGAMIVEHNRARHYVAEVDLTTNHISLPLETEFPDHPRCQGDELTRKAMELLESRIEIYRDRGYEIREVEQQPGYETEMYDEDKIPVVVVYMARQLSSKDQLFDELPWLVEQLAGT